MAYQRALFAAFASIALVSCSQGVPKSAHQRTAEEIRQAIGPTGQTSYGTNTSHQDYIAYLAPGGTIQLKSGTFTDKGVYRIENDGHVCVKYTKVFDGAERCQLTYQDGDDVYSVLGDGMVTSVSHRRVAGNPEHL